MRVVWVVLACLLLVPACFAFDQQVNVLVYPNGTAEERYTLTVTSLVSAPSVVFPLERGTQTILYAGNYTRNETALTLVYPIKPGVNKIDFLIVRENASVGVDSLRRYGGTFSTRKDTRLSVSVTLPEGMVLRDIDPAVSPRPTAIRSDGRSVVIDWVQTGPLDAIVLFETPSVGTTVSEPLPSTEVVPRLVPTRTVLAIAAGIIVAGLVLVLGRLARSRRTARRTRKSALMDALGADEQKIVEFIRHGYSNQKQIAQEAGFSKSKMSKVVRKLEEKHVVSKRPHFKTNKLTLLPDWK